MGALRSDILYFTNYSLGASEPILVSSGTASIQTTTVKTGTYALRTNPTTTGQGSHLNQPLATNGTLATGTGSPIYYSKFAFLYKTKPASNDESIFTVVDVGGGTPNLS